MDQTNSLHQQLAQVAHDLGNPIGGPAGTGLGPFSQIGGETEGLTRVTQVISAIIGVITIAAGIFFIINLLIAGIGYISTGGDKHGLEDAQKRITNSLIGIVIVAASWSILALTGRFLGFDILISSPDKIIHSFFP